MREILLKQSAKDADMMEYWLRKRYMKTTATLEQLALLALNDIAAMTAQDEVDRMNKRIL